MGIGTTTSGAGVLQRVRQLTAGYDAASPIILGSRTRPEPTALTHATTEALVSSARAMLADPRVDLQVLANRGYGGVLDTLVNDVPLRRGGGNLGIGHTRTADERRLGLATDGVRSEATYGTLHVASRLDDRRGGASLLNIGQSYYGGVAVRIGTHVLEGSTLAAVDTIQAQQLLPPTDVARAFAEAIANRAWRGDQRLSGVMTGERVPSADELHEIVTDLTITGRERGSAFSNFLDGVPEVQVLQDVRRRDITELRLAGSPPQAVVDRLGAAAEAHGIEIAVDGGGSNASNLQVWGPELLRRNPLLQRDRVEHIALFEGWDEAAKLWVG